MWRTARSKGGPSGNGWRRELAATLVIALPQRLLDNPVGNQSGRHGEHERPHEFRPMNLKPVPAELIYTFIHAGRRFLPSAGPPEGQTDHTDTVVCHSVVNADGSAY